MKNLFSKSGESFYLADEDKMIFCIDGICYDKSGNEVPPVRAPYYDDEEDKKCDREWMGNEGLAEPLKSESIVEIEWEIDDGFGKFGFKNEAGEFVIEPQYAYAREFTNGLACVNLNRTWYKTEKGRRYYENHYGYIDGNGKTVIGFQYDEAYPFNKYGIALVSDLKTGWHLIDTSGNEIPETRFAYISHYHDYDDRFIEFSYDKKAEYGDELVGIYDTKERKILLEPSVEDIIEWNEDCIMVYERSGEYGPYDFRQYYINSKGEIVYPWLYNKGFSIVEIPDNNNVTAVAITEFMELTGNPSSYFPHNGKKYSKKYIYGLYSSKSIFLLPMEYDEIKNLCGNVWGCLKDGIITIIETEKED